MKVFTELRLPNGSSLPNRIAKAAMEENMADADQAPSEALMQLFGLLTPESFRIVASSTTTGIVESFLPLD